MFKFIKSLIRRLLRRNKNRYSLFPRRYRGYTIGRKKYGWQGQFTYKGKRYCLYGRTKRQVERRITKKKNELLKEELEKIK